MVIVIAVALLLGAEEIKEDARFTEGQEVEEKISNTNLFDIGMQLYKLYFINQIKMNR
jgi:hypothetical protein